MAHLQKAIKKALDEINEFLPSEGKISMSCDEVLIGPNGILDSLSTATFLLELENEYANESGEKIDFTELIMSEDGLVGNFKIIDLENLIKNEH